MSARKSPQLQVLIMYGNTGRDDLLAEVGDALLEGENFGTIDIPVARKATKQIFRLLARPTKARSTLRGYG